MHKFCESCSVVWSWGQLHINETGADNSLKNHEKKCRTCNYDVKLYPKFYRVQFWEGLMEVHGTMNEFEWAPAGSCQNLTTGKTEVSIEIDFGAYQELRKQCTFEFNLVFCFLFYKKV